MDIPDIHLKVIYDFEYETKDERRIQIVRGEKLFLLNKTNSDWWQVIRNSSERPFYVPASYVIEVTRNKLSSDGKSHSSVEGDLHYPSLNSSIHRKHSSLETFLERNLHLKSHHTTPINGCDYKAQVIEPNSNSYTLDAAVSSVLSHERNTKKLCDDNFSDGISGQKVAINAKPVNLKHDIVPLTTKRNRTPELLSDKEKICGDRSVHLGISLSHSCEENKEFNHDESNRSVEKEKNRTLSGSWEKLLHKMKFGSVHKQKDPVSSANDSESLSIPRDSHKKLSTQVGKELGTYPREVYGQGKTKLAYSRSFETKHELKGISIHQQRKSHLAAASLDGQKIFVNSLKSSIEESTTLNKTGTEGKCFKDSYVDLPSYRDLSATRTPPFQNPSYMVNQVADVNRVESTESLDGYYLDDECISDSGTSFKSSELLPVRDQLNETWSTIHEDVNFSSCEEIDFPGNRDSVPLPSGWRKSYDDITGEQCYISDLLQAKWFSSTDHDGRIYFFEENSAESSWTLPKISIEESEVPSKKSLPEVPVDQLLRCKDGEKRSVSRITKARSLLVSDKKQRDSSNKSSSIPRNFLQDKSAILKEGPLNRTKITENGKKVRKNWVITHVVLKELFLLFYKDPKSVQPEIVVELSEALLESGGKMSKRKNVFLISTTGLQVLCQADSPQVTIAWCEAIKKAIDNLDKSSMKLLSPKSQEEEDRCSPLIRSRSLRNKNQDVEDQMSSNEEQQTKIRNRLKRFFNRRPTRETLAIKGIYKDEPVFDNHLEKVCTLESPRIPKFVQLCISVIEGKEENMKADGLYRASGNLSHVQKIRLEVDQNNLHVLEREEDVHVLTGALKLFFRELKEPLIPFELVANTLENVNCDKTVRIKMFQDIVEQLPVPNRDTLTFLLRHLRKVTKYEEYNRMHIPNLAIVFGPTLIWRGKESHQNNMALEYMQQNLVIEFFLLQFDEIFKKFELPNS